MGFVTVYDGVVFDEGVMSSARIGAPISVDLSFKIGAQLKSLRDVKARMAMLAKEGGYNAVVNFTYGQKSRWLAVDNVAYWGKGDLALIPHEEYAKICEDKRQG